MKDKNGQTFYDLCVKNCHEDYLAILFKEMPDAIDIHSPIISNPGDKNVVPISEFL